MRDKKFSTENLDTPPPLLSINTFSLPDIFWNTDQKGSSTKFFGTVRQQIFDRKSWYFPLRHKTFRYPRPSETQKGFSTKWFGTVRQNNFDGKSRCSSHVLYLTFLPPRILRNTERFLYEILWHCERKVFDRKSWYSLPPFFYPSIFLIP